MGRLLKSYYIVLDYFIVDTSTSHSGAILEDVLLGIAFKYTYVTVLAVTEMVDLIT